MVVSNPFKNISQVGSFPQVGMKIKNLWNHHLVNMTPYKSPPFLDVATLPQTNIAPENWMVGRLITFLLGGFGLWPQVPCWLKPRWGDIDPFTITCKPTTFFLHPGTVWTSATLVPKSCEGPVKSKTWMHLQHQTISLGPKSWKNPKHLFICCLDL